jgi:hypothetical protein
MMAPVIFLIVVTGLATLNSLLHVRRGHYLRRENAALKAKLLMLGGGEDSEDGISPAELAARMMATLIDVTGPVTEAANGARKQREAEGWSPTAAEQMAMMLYMLGVMKIAAPALAAAYGSKDSDDHDGS